MTPEYFITHVEQLASGAGLSIDELCRKAKVARSTFTRWKNGDSKPTFNTISKFEKAVNKHNGKGKRT